ncbi:MAG: APC family permease [Acidimicrobiales bacterium]
MAESKMKSSIGLPAALSIGIGGMIGAGIFSILGVVAGISGSALPISFAIGGVVAGLAAYSYVALGKAFPTVGGSVTFLVRGYGEGVLSGSLSLFQYFSFIITIALYATGFAAYAGTFIALPSKVWAVGVVLAFTLINFLGTRTMGRAESIIVIIKLTILVVFIVAAFVALPGRGLDRLSPATWPGPLAVLSGAAVLFVGYEGFGLITNAAANMTQPTRELPRAIYGSVATVIVIYILVAIGVVTNVPLDVLRGLGDSALAVAARPSLGETGFRLVAIAALLATASAVNATLFGSANVAYQIAKNGDLPPAFTRELWGRDVEGLFITSALVLVFVLLFPLSAVASMGSAGFLLIYAAVSIGHLRIRTETGAKAWPILASAVTCLALLIVLAYKMATSAPKSLIALGVTLAVSFVFEVAYRRITGRTFRAILRRSDPGFPGRGAH